MTMHLPIESNGPHAELQPDDQLFAPFIGSWDLEVTWYDGDVVTRRENGEWHFAWVLEGRAVQDVWIVPRREDRHNHPDLYEYGTSVRFHDPTIQAWRSTWIGPMQHTVRTFVARRVDEGVQLETRLDENRRLRWTFTDIEPDSFRWTNATEADGRWLVTQRFTASRHPARGDNR
jgi:hypothetical protein